MIGCQRQSIIKTIKGEEGGIWIWDGSQKSERPCFLLPDGGGTLNHGDGCDSRSRGGERIEDGVRSSWLLSLCLLGTFSRGRNTFPSILPSPPPIQKISLLNFFHDFPSWFKWITFFSTTRDFDYEFGIVGYSIEDDEEAREESERGGKKGGGRERKRTTGFSRKISALGGGFHSLPLFLFF